MGARWGRGERVSGRPCSPILFSRTVPPPPSQPNWLFSLGAGVRLHSHHGEAGWVSPGGREPFPATLLPPVQPPPRGCRSPVGSSVGRRRGWRLQSSGGRCQRPQGGPGSPAGRGRSLALETAMPSGRQLCQQPCCVALSPLRKKNANPLPGMARASGTHRGQARGGGAPTRPSPPSGHLKLSSSKTRRHLPEPAPARCSLFQALSPQPVTGKHCRSPFSDVPGPAVPAAQRPPPHPHCLSRPPPALTPLSAAACPVSATCGTGHLAHRPHCPGPQSPPHSTVPHPTRHLPPGAQSWARIATTPH